MRSWRGAESTSTGVGGSIFRVNRDTRFSKDKRPYKAHLDLWFWQGAKSRDSPGYFFRLTPRMLYLGAGMHGFDRDLLDRYRDAVVDEMRGRQLAASIAAVTARGAELGGRTYKRVPRGLPADHERAPLLLHSGLYAGYEMPVPAEARGAAFVGFCADHFEHVRPLQEWLAALAG